ncbi:hypothetical protein Bbelb_003730 [Branchiostoma belcheri]|nr:hypothetical protein Bbelb_003730 [Branchiostoma belcheri]
MPNLPPVSPAASENTHRTKTKPATCAARDTRRCDRRRNRPGYSSPYAHRLGRKMLTNIEVTAGRVCQVWGSVLKVLPPAIYRHSLQTMSSTSPHTGSYPPAVIPDCATIKSLFICAPHRTEADRFHRSRLGGLKGSVKHRAKRLAMGKMEVQMSHSWNYGSAPGYKAGQRGFARHTCEQEKGRAGNQRTDMLAARWKNLRRS